MMNMYSRHLESWSSLSDRVKLENANSLGHPCPGHTISHKAGIRDWVCLAPKQKKGINIHRCLLCAELYYFPKTLTCTFKKGFRVQWQGEWLVGSLQLLAPSGWPQLSRGDSWAGE